MGELLKLVGAGGEQPAYYVIHDARRTDLPGVFPVHSSGALTLEQAEKSGA